MISSLAEPKSGKESIKLRKFYGFLYIDSRVRTLYLRLHYSENYLSYPSNV